MPTRSPSRRRADAVHRLQTDPDVWVATSSAGGLPHLVPLSLAWDGDHVLVATPSHTVTVRNAVASGTVRAALDSASDVVIVDATVEVLDFDSVDPHTAASYVGRVGWDPRDEPGEWSLLVLTPTRVLAWRGVAEIEDRTIMRDGVWADGDRPVSG